MKTIGRSAGGRPIQAVFYGRPRSEKGTTTFSGALGYGDVCAWIGPDHARKVYLAMASVHGGEFEGIVGIVNLLAVLETGSDLRGRRWPGITAVASNLDRDHPHPHPERGRTGAGSRSGWESTAGPTRRLPSTSTQAHPDGSLLGWPQCKEFIPLDFSRTQFPGGYPNDAGVNVQHDDFFGRPQPETRALLDLAAEDART